MFRIFKEATTELKDIEGLLKGHVNGKVTKHVLEPLTSFGENFGSEILRVEATVEENGKEKVFHAVAKLIPPSEEQLKNFNTQVTFKNEIAFYDVIVPTLQEFQREYKLKTEIADYFPKLYGGRINLKPNSDVVDLDAVILLENLKTEGYYNADRKGFDLDTTKQILQILANFQGTAIALKQKKPEVFQSKIRPYLGGLKTQTPRLKNKDGEDPLLGMIDKILKENHNTAHLSNRFRKYWAKKHVKKAREPWSSIIHNDLWVNNIMILQKNEKTHIKLVDFQLTDFGSTASDLIFFLFTSVQTPVLKYHFNKLLLFYHNELIKTLQLFKADLKDFSYEDFLDEINQEMQHELKHSLFTLIVIFGPKGVPRYVGKVAEWNPHKLSDELANGGPPASSHSGPTSADHKRPQLQMVFPPLPPLCKEKMCIILEEAAKHHWI